MKKGKFIFESFQEYVETVLEKKEAGLITEAEARADLAKAATTMVGDLSLKGTTKAKAERFFEQFEEYLGDNTDLAGKVNSAVSSAFEILKNAQKGIGINTANRSLTTEGLTKPYRWLILGEVQAKGVPNPATGAMSTETKRIRLFDLLGVVNAYNFITIDKNVRLASQQKKEKNAKQYLGSEPANSYVHLVEDSMAQRTLEFITKSQESPAGGNFEFPIYNIESFVKDAGNNIEKYYFEEVIKPGGTETVIKDKPYNSSGTDFFEENEVVISAEGMDALKAMVSGFNKITEIKVNGSASSKPTSRAGGNQKLAEDRRAAGIKALEDLKASEVEQLKSAKISQGTAGVQEGPASESDPAMQQVSFVISGNARKSEVVNTEAVTIKKVDASKADSFKIRKSYFDVTYTGDITA